MWRAVGMSAPPPAEGGGGAATAAGDGSGGGGCTVWPRTDTLFIIDSTVHVGGAANHRKLLKFAEEVVRQIYGSSGEQQAVSSGDTTVAAVSTDSTVALVQYTPEVKYEFGFLADDSAQRTAQRISELTYAPCLKWEHCERGATSLNALVEWMSSSADEATNRALVPDIIVLVSTSLYAPPALRSGESLARPRSPIHFFHVVVGVDARTIALSRTGQVDGYYATAPPPVPVPQQSPADAPTGGGGSWALTQPPPRDIFVDSDDVVKRLRDGARLQFAATTAYLAVADFDALADLVAPLCESVRSFLEGMSLAAERSRPVDLSWWRYLQWNVSTCTRINDRNTAFWTIACDSSAGRGGPAKPPELLAGSFCVLCIAAVVGVAAVIVAVLLYALYLYKQSGDRLNRQLLHEREDARRQEEYYRGQLHERAEHEKERERTMLDLVNENVRIREQYRDEQIRREQATAMQKAVPVTFTRKRGRGGGIQAVIGGAAGDKAGGPGEPTLMALMDSRSLSEPPQRFFLQPPGAQTPTEHDRRHFNTRNEGTTNHNKPTSTTTKTATSATKPTAAMPKKTKLTTLTMKNLLPRAPLAVVDAKISSGGNDGPAASVSAGGAQTSSSDIGTPLSMVGGNGGAGGSRIYVSVPTRNSHMATGKQATVNGNTVKQNKDIEKTQILSLDGPKSSATANRTNVGGAKKSAKTGKAKTNATGASAPTANGPTQGTTKTAVKSSAQIQRRQDEGPNFRRKNRLDDEGDELDDEEENEDEEEEADDADDGFSDFDRSFSNFDDDHPALSLPPVDVLLLIDASSSIGNRNFEEVKYCLRKFTNEMDISPGRSRVAVVLFAAEPQTYFDFNRYYTNKSVSAAIRRMPYLGGPTFLAKALSFSAGVLSQEQSLKRVHKHLRFLPTPKHDRPQVMVVVSDGISDDNFDRQATHVHERLYVKVAAIVTKSYNREKLRAVTHYDGAIFTLTEIETLTIWLWNVQKMWNEKYGEFVEREKSFQADRSFNAGGSRASHKPYGDDGFDGQHSV